MSKEVQLTKGFVALIDDDDFEEVNKYKWTASEVRKGKFYAVRSVYKNGVRKTQYLHRFIMGVTDKKIQVDHINCNTMDNRKNNLRTCNNSQNSMNKKPQKNNTSGKSGVSFDKTYNKWHARIKKDRKTIHLGYFTNLDDAIKARKQAEVKYFGEFRHKTK